MTDSSLRIVFAGTPDFAAHHLQALIDSPHEIVGVYTQPDRRAGRGKKLVGSPVKQMAEQHGLSVFQPLNFKEQADRDELASLEADVMVVVAYGLLLPQSVLDIPKYGCINVHASLLPRWRGAAPIQRCIEAGDTETGVTIMQMDKGLDTGDMLLKTQLTLAADETGGSLHDRLLEQGGPALLEVLSAMASGSLNPVVQPEQGVTYAHKFGKADSEIDWSESVDSIDRKVRAYNPFPVAHCLWQGQSLRVWEAERICKPAEAQAGDIVAVSAEGIEVACGEGRFLLKVIQLPGKKALSVADVLNGNRDLFQVGMSFVDHDSGTAH